MVTMHLKRGHISMWFSTHEPTHTLPIYSQQTLKNHRIFIPYQNVFNLLANGFSQTFQSLKNMSVNK